VRQARRIEEQFNPVQRNADSYIDGRAGEAPPPGQLCALCGRGSQQPGGLSSNPSAGVAEASAGGDAAAAAATESPPGNQLVGPFADRTASATSRHAGIWVHELCAGYSPEVAQEGDRWFNLVSAVRRGRKLKCATCRTKGATIGCFLPSCHRSFHVSCAEGTQWDFEAEDQGKFFYCPAHREAPAVDRALPPKSGRASPRVLDYGANISQMSKHWPPLPLPPGATLTLPRGEALTALLLGSANLQ